MSHFLWIEDFAGGTLQSATETVFGEMLKNQPLPKTEKALKELLKKNGVLVEFTFLDGLEFIRNPQKWLSVDYVILDIDLAIQSDIDENEWLPKILQDYYGYEPQEDEMLDEQNFDKAKERLIPVAGYQLYTELVMEHGFPKDHILFCSNHANEQKALQAAFQQARFEFPQPFSKDDKAKVQAWVRQRRENHYAVLRRGILEGCRTIQSLLNQRQKAAIQFDEFVKVDNDSRNVTVAEMQDYLETLPNLLPLRKPENCQRFYKLFIRSLAHEWDAAYPDNLSACDKNDKSCIQARRVKYTFGWIMKCVRNWGAHTTMFDKLAEPEVAFLFIVAMRAMFKLSDNTEAYENILLNLFNKTDSSAMKKRIGSNGQTQIPLSRSYWQVKNKLFQSEAKDVLSFHNMLNNLSNIPVEYDYVTGLFQMFWHGLSPVKLDALRERGEVVDNNQTVVFKYNYSFPVNDYGKPKAGFLFELARSIYKRSFKILS